MVLLPMVKTFIETTIKHADTISREVDTWAQDNSTSLGEDVVDSLAEW